MVLSPSFLFYEVAQLDPEVVQLVIEWIAKVQKLDGHTKARMAPVGERRRRRTDDTKRPHR